MTQDIRNRPILSPLHFIVSVLLIVFVGFEYQLSGDFSIYMAAAEQLGLGSDIYDIYYGANKDLPYMASPALAFIFYPLSLLPLGVSAALWKTLNILLLFRLWALFERYFTSVDWEGKQHRHWILLSVLSLSFILYRNFHLSQFSVMLIYLIFESINQTRTGKYLVLGPLLLALGITVKILPIVAIPYLLFRGFWKEVILSLAFLGILLFLPSINMGIEKAYELNRSWLSSISPRSDQNVFDVSQQVVHGIAALISTLTIDGIGNNFSLSIRRHIVDLNPDVVVGIILATKALLLLSVLYVLKLKTFFKDHGFTVGSFYELSYILLITPLVFPQSRIYTFLFLLPAMTYIAYVFIKKSLYSPKWVKVLFWISILVINLELLLGNFRELYWHFKTLTYASLIVLFLFIWLKPERVKHSTNSDSEEEIS